MPRTIAGRASTGAQTKAGFVGTHRIARKVKRRVKQAQARIAVPPMFPEEIVATVRELAALGLLEIERLDDPADPDGMVAVRFRPPGS